MSCVYKIDDLINKDTREMIKDLINDANMNVSTEQVKAWYRQIIFLRNNLKECNKNHYIIFEYELSEGKRPDVIIITNKTVISLEFKTGPKAMKNIDASLDQAYSYKKRIEKYHVITRDQGYKVKSYLVFSHKDANTTKEILNNENFKEAINDYLIEDTICEDKLKEWILSPYQAIPSIFESISHVFNTGKLPEIVKSKSDINGTMKLIDTYIEKPKNRIQVIFVSGEPGSGKTLLGISLVNKYKGRARMLTGNGPLSKVLQYQIDKATKDSLSGEAFIGHLTNWISQGEERVKKINRPNWKEDIFIFDEAQRSWNEEYNKKKRRIENSQPEQMLKLIHKEILGTNKNITLICLIGDGQEIHSGEQEGMKNWSKAIDKINNHAVAKYFYVSAPSVVVENFGCKDNIEVNDKLYLNDYFRGYEEDRYPKWVNALLEYNEDELKLITKQLNEDRYPIYITKSLNSARKYIDKRYNTYGICISAAGSYGLKKYCSEKVRRYDKLNTNTKLNKYILDEVKEELGPWFSGECKELKTYVTEFNSQGLEVDFEIFAFGGDFELRNGKWEVNKIISDFKEDEKLYMSKNKHRVLLTRCREGIILWLPNIKSKDGIYYVNDELYNRLKSIGIREI